MGGIEQHSDTTEAGPGRNLTVSQDLEVVM
jgi:hypothetical protein